MCNMCQFLMFPMPIHLFATCCLFKSHGIQTSHQVTTTSCGRCWAWASREAILRGQ